MNGGVLFLDLATTMGWCEGIPGTGARPISGTQRLAPKEAGPAGIFGGMLDFLAQRLTTFRYRAIVYEAPMDPRHMKTNLNTARMLLGLPAIVEAVAHQTGHWRVMEASVHDVRKHLLGRRPAAGDAKRSVIEALRAQGYDPRDDNEADAIAGWLYACAVIEKKVSHTGSPLWSAASR